MFRPSQHVSFPPISDYVSTPAFRPYMNMPSIMASPTFTQSSMYGRSGMFHHFKFSSCSGANGDETPRQLFFRQLSSALKEANRHYSGKVTSWKNPFLYKNSLCDHYRNNGYCRYGVNCWYAHGIHELRSIPDTEELPTPEFMTQYLSFLGLPLPVLSNIIKQAYQNANCQKERQWFIPKSPKPSPTSSVEPSLSENSIDLDFQHRLKINDAPSVFDFSVASNGNWAHLRAMIDGTVDESDSHTCGTSTFASSFHLFGDDYPLKRGGKF